MRMIKEAKLKIVSQALTIGCKIQISVRENEADRIYSLFTNTYKVNIKKLEN